MAFVIQLLLHLHIKHLKNVEIPTPQQGSMLPYFWLTYHVQKEFWLHFWTLESLPSREDHAIDDKKKCQIKFKKKNCLLQSHILASSKHFEL